MNEIVEAGLVPANTKEKHFAFSQFSCINNTSLLWNTVFGEIMQASTPLLYKP